MYGIAVQGKVVAEFKCCTAADTIARFMRKARPDLNVDVLPLNYTPKSPWLVGA